MNGKRLLLVLLLSLSILGCKRPRKVATSFYYWKTIYKHNPTEDAYLNRLQVHRLYVRIMDVNEGENGIGPVPVSPIEFKDQLPDSLQIVPVVFVVNEVLRHLSQPQLRSLAGKINYFVTGKLKQAGKSNFKELQLDCDWTKTTRSNYFYLMGQLRQLLAKQHQSLSFTLRLHQLKNQQGSGVPPADRALLMCYNMGNLRKYGSQNSILDLAELKKYAGNNLSNYPLPLDVALPLFSWAVVFRQQQYAGIAKRLNQAILQDTTIFSRLPNQLYTAKTDMPSYGLKAKDEVRWETPDQLTDAASYLSSYLKSDNFTVIYFHLDQQTLKPYPYEKLEAVTHLLH